MKKHSATHYDRLCIVYTHYDRLCIVYRENGMNEWAEEIEASISNGEPIDYRSLPNINQATQRSLAAVKILDELSISLATMRNK